MTTRTIDEFRKRKIRVLDLAFQRPSMFFNTASEAELFFQDILADLC